MSVPKDVERIIRETMQPYRQPTQKRCKIPGCPNVYYAKGLCRKHRREMEDGEIQPSNLSSNELQRIRNALEAACPRFVLMIGFRPLAEIAAEIAAENRCRASSTPAVHGDGMSGLRIASDLTLPLDAEAR